MNPEHVNNYKLTDTGVSKKYTIPLRRNNMPEPLPMTDLPNASTKALKSANVERFKQAESYNNFAEAPSAPKQQKVVKDATVEVTKLTIFQGRDESYPDELNQLIQPLSCQLCKVHLTSIKSAKDHYESMAHDRHISGWLAKKYTEAGLECPNVKRLVKKGPTGPNAYHCELCDLNLTSLTHARQHYTGRKHQLVEQNRTKPSGMGYYNTDGKWVRTGTKAMPNCDNAYDKRFGIGEKFLNHDIPDADAIAASVLPIDANNDSKSKPCTDDKPPALPVDDSLCCKICKISVTSASQMKMHLDGAKHQKKLRNLNEPQSTENSISGDAETIEMTEITTSSDVTDVNAVEELAMYRTPSGSYYCKLCNKLMNHVSILQQHLQGKKHLKTLRQESNTK